MSGSGYTAMHGGHGSGDGGPLSPEMQFQLDLARGISMASIWLLSLITGLLPLYTRKDSDKYRNHLSCASMLAAGVFFGSALVHLLPESQTEMAQFLERAEITLKSSPTFALLSCATSFMILLFVEVIATWYMERNKDMKFLSGHDHGDGDADGGHGHGHSHGADGHGHGHGHGHGKTVETPKKEKSSTTPYVAIPETPTHDDAAAAHSHDHKHGPGSTTLYGAVNTETIPPRSPLPNRDMLTVHTPLIENGDASTLAATEMTDCADDCKEASHHHVDHPHFEAPTKNGRESFRGYVLLLALSFHSLLEGLPMGAAVSSTGVYEVLVAVLLHKGLASFALGVSLVQQGLPKWSIIRLMTFYTLVSPAGTAIGWAFYAKLDESVYLPLATSIMNSLAAGTFIYVSCLEIIPHELAQHDNLNVLKILLLASGYLLILLLTFWLDDLW